MLNKNLLSADISYLQHNVKLCHKDFLRYAVRESFFKPSQVTHTWTTGFYDSSIDLHFC